MIQPMQQLPETFTATRLPEIFIPQPNLDRSKDETDGPAYRNEGIPYTVGIVAGWPVSVEYNDDGGEQRTYYRTGKLGVRVDEDSNVPCAEYQCQGRGVWLLLSGELRQD